MLSVEKKSYQLRSFKRGFRVTDTTCTSRSPQAWFPVCRTSSILWSRRRPHTYNYHNLKGSRLAVLVSACMSIVPLVFPMISVTIPSSNVAKTSVAKTIETRKPKTGARIINHAIDSQRQVGKVWGIGTPAPLKEQQAGPGRSLTKGGLVERALGFIAGYRGIVFRLGLLDRIDVHECSSSEYLTHYFFLFASVSSFSCGVHGTRQLHSGAPCRRPSPRNAHWIGCPKRHQVPS